MANVCVECRNPQARTDGDSHCLKCNSKTIYINLQYWSPPKKNNLRAWKRIANGEWLWDRRRVLRTNRRHWNSWEFVSLPNHKKYQKLTCVSVSKSKRSTADLGG
jgi:hypothetical protein